MGSFVIVLCLVLLFAPTVSWILYSSMIGTLSAPFICTEIIDYMAVFTFHCYSFGRESNIVFIIIFMGQAESGT